MYPFEAYILNMLCSTGEVPGHWKTARKNTDLKDYCGAILERLSGQNATWMARISRFLEQPLFLSTVEP
jgi:hypothetical protein